jgi:hypothetical protein
MTTTSLPDGLYRIQVVGGAQPLYLTRERSDVVTVLPPGDHLNSVQEVMCLFLTSSIACCSPAILVANHQR